MRLDELRNLLTTNPSPIDQELLRDMDEKLQKLAGGGFIKAYADQVKMFDTGTQIRPNFSNEMQIMYMRDRQTFMFALIPELMPIAYQVGRMVGSFFDAPRREGMGLPEALATGINVADMHKYGHQEVVKADEEFAIYRTYECADCYGMPNIGMKICVYEAGVTAGAIEKILGNLFRVRKSVVVQMEIHFANLS